MSADCRIAPRTAAGPRCGLSVEFSRDPARALARGEVRDDAIKGLGEHNVELAFTHILKEFLITRPEVARARYATVGVCCGERPFFANNPLSANKELVLN